MLMDSNRLPSHGFHPPPKNKNSTTNVLCSELSYSPVFWDLEGRRRNGVPHTTKKRSHLFVWNLLGVVLAAPHAIIPTLQRTRRNGMPRLRNFLSPHCCRTFLSHLSCRRLLTSPNAGTLWAEGKVERFVLVVSAIVSLVAMAKVVAILIQTLDLLILDLLRLKRFTRLTMRADEIGALALGHGGTVVKVMGSGAGLGLAPLIVVSNITP